METRKCIKCQAEYSLELGYSKHKRSPQGRLSTCKKCMSSIKKAANLRYKEDPEWVERQRVKARNDYHKVGYKPGVRTAHTAKAYRERYPEKDTARSHSQKVVVGKGLHKHHWSYNKEHWKDCIGISRKEHAKAHRYMIYDQERMMYRTLEGVLLDTREAHEEYVFNAIKDLP